MNSIDPSLWTPATITNDYTALQSHFIAKMGKKRLIHASLQRGYINAMAYRSLGLASVETFFLSHRHVDFFLNV